MFTNARLCWARPSLQLVPTGLIQSDRWLSPEVSSDNLRIFGLRIQPFSRHFGSYSRLLSLNTSSLRGLYVKMKAFSECCAPCCPGDGEGEQAEQQQQPGQLPPGSRLVSGTIAQQGEPRYLEPLVQVGVYSLFSKIWRTQLCCSGGRQICPQLFHLLQTAIVRSTFLFNEFSLQKFLTVTAVSIHTA